MFNLTVDNLDLLSVAIAITAIGILGFLIFFNNRKSITNRTFLYFSLLTIIWGISNYLEYKFSTPFSALWALRVHLFISVFHAFFFFQLCYVFPVEVKRFNFLYKFFVLPLTLITAILTLTPLVFENITELAPIGQVTNPTRGPAIFLFIFVAIGLLLTGLGVLFIKIFKSKDIEKRQTIFVFIGMLLTAFLIVMFNVVLPVTFNDLRFIPYAALFLFPLITFISYTIYKHKLFNIKVAATAILAFFITTFSFINIIFSKELNAVILNITAFTIILIGSIRLIRDMLRLEIANEKLRELDRQKSEFVSFASHQLRSPLTAMKGYASLIVEGDYGPISDDLKSAVSRILESSNTLATVVNDYLNISRIELGTVKYNFKEVDERALVQTVIDELRPTIKTAGLKLSFEVFSNDSYKVLADPDQLKQVITNIIDNSIKYTPQGSVSVSIERKDSKILLSVKDTGIGIAKETIPLLFEKFSRAKGADEVNIRGTGLGLYIAKEIIIAHGGKIWVESEGEGKGSQFYVELNVKA